MKVYFTAAIFQKPEFGKYYDRIVAAIQSEGHTVQHEHITGASFDDLKTKTSQDINGYYRQAVRWIASSDLIVVEASFPSTLNIGHEISLALERGKPVAVLYKAEHDSVFLHGLNSDKLLLVEYTDENLEEVLKESLGYAKDSADSRFNFFISPRHITYLDWVSKVRRIPRSVYLRQLIEHDREANQEYHEQR